MEEQLGARCREAGIDCVMLTSAAKDLNDDLQAEPFDQVRDRVLAQLHPEDRRLFMR